MTTPFIQCTAIRHGYRRGSERVEVLHNLDFVVAEREFVALMGPSGSGKSTLLNLIAGLEAPEAGSIVVDGVSISELPQHTLSAWRAANVGFVFQFYNLIPVLSAIDNVALPLLLTNLSRAERAERALAALEIVDLVARRKHKPSELSGGQQQRVALARALVSDPKLLVCDEPTGDLDRASANEVLALLETLHQQFDKTIVMVTHDPEAARHAGHVWHMDKGALLPAAGAAA